MPSLRRMASLNIQQNNMKYLLTILLLIVLSGCHFSKQKHASNTLIEYSYRNPAGKLLSKGYINSDSIQTGLWEYYTDSTTTARGQFANGLQYGRWSYDYIFFKGTIDWDTLNMMGALRLNYPNDFKHSLEPSECILSSPDSSVEIEIRKTPTPKDIEEVKTETANLIKSDGYTISRVQCNHMIYHGNSSYFVLYDISKGNKKGLDYRLILNSGKECILVRMSAKEFNTALYQYLMTVYLGIANNLFLNDQKVIDPNRLSSSPC